MTITKLPITHIFFDVGNTLMNFDFSAVAAITQEAMSAAALQQQAPALWKALNAYLELQWRTGQPAKIIDFIAEFLFHSVDTASKAHYTAALSTLNNSNTLWRTVNQDAMSVMTALLQQKFKLAVISNGDGRVHELLNHHDWPQFDDVIDSALVGCSKPDKRIFDLALQRAGDIAPASALYVGDLPAIDARGAALAGLVPVIYDPHAIFEAECHRLAEETACRVYRIRTMRELFNNTFSIDKAYADI